MRDGMEWENQGVTGEIEGGEREGGEREGGERERGGERGGERERETLRNLTNYVFCKQPV